MGVQSPGMPCGRSRIFGVVKVDIFPKRLRMYDDRSSRLHRQTLPASTTTRGAHRGFPLFTSSSPQLGYCHLPSSTHDGYCQDESAALLNPKPRSSVLAEMNTTLSMRRVYVGAIKTT
jgi:hypothetical protein